MAMFSQTGKTAGMGRSGAAYLGRESRWLVLAGGGYGVKAALSSQPHH